MPEGEGSQREEGSSSRKSLETRLQAEDDGEPWRIRKLLQQRKTADNQSAISKIDEANPAVISHAISAGDNREDSKSDDVKEGFYRYFEREYAELQFQMVQLDRGNHSLNVGEIQDAIDNITARITRLGNKFSDSSRSISRSEQRGYSQASLVLKVKDLHVLIQEGHRNP